MSSSHTNGQPVPLDSLSVAGSVVASLVPGSLVPGSLVVLVELSEVPELSPELLTSVPSPVALVVEPVASLLSPPVLPVASVDDGAGPHAASSKETRRASDRV